MFGLSVSLLRAVWIYLIGVTVENNFSEDAFRPMTGSCLLVIDFDLFAAPDVICAGYPEVVLESMVGDTFSEVRPVEGAGGASDASVV